MAAQKIESTHPYKLLMSCGHLEIRMMREATAGIPFASQATLKVATSGCCECEPSKAVLREHQRQLNAKYGLGETHE